MPVIQTEIIQSAQFIPGNMDLIRVSHQNTVNAFLATIPNAQNVLQIESALDTISSSAFRFRSTITYYQP